MNSSNINSRKNKAPESFCNGITRALMILWTVILFSQFHGCSGGGESGPAQDDGGETSGFDFYVSSDGSDSNSGTSASSPFKTFSFAISQLLPGDTLILLDGTYNKSNSGYLNINCASNAKNGTATKPITVKAQNERKAFIQSDGTATPLSIQNCSYWNIQGVRSANADNSSSNNEKSHVFSVKDSSNIKLRRMLGAYTNRYYNAHVYSIGNSSNILIEESEAYSFHRHGFSIYQSSFVTLRRNYANSRNYSDLPDYKTNTTSGGDEGLAFYNTTDSIMENNISEGNFCVGDYGKRNFLAGNISFKSSQGFAISKPTTSTFLSQDNSYIDNAAFSNSQNGFISRSQERTIMENCTSINNGQHGFSADNGRDPDYYSGATWGDITPSIEIRNSLSLRNSKNSGFVIRHSEDFAYRIMDVLDAFANSPNYGSGTEVKTNSFTTDPKMYDSSTGQGCIVYVPTGSPIKSLNIGANIVYRSENGLPTSTKLWDQTTGAFPCGAVVAGLNDDQSNSCIGVHERLNVGVNGCPIP